MVRKPSRRASVAETAKVGRQTEEQIVKIAIRVVMQIAGIIIEIPSVVAAKAGGVQCRPREKIVVDEITVTIVTGDTRETPEGIALAALTRTHATLDCWNSRSEPLRLLQDL